MRVIKSLIVVIAFFVPALALAAATVSISPNLPGSLSVVSSPGGWIKSFYNYALFISGFLAFGAIVYGGIKYAIARGNPSQESEARQWIWSALLGMLLLAAAYLILYTVNPNLVNLSLPNLPQAQVNGAIGGVSAPQVTQSQINAVKSQPCNGVCPASQCQADNTCKTIFVGSGTLKP